MYRRLKWKVNNMGCSRLKKCTKNVWAILIAHHSCKNINKKQKNAPIGTPIYKLSSVKAVSSKLNVKFFKINHYIHVQNRHMIQFTIRQSYKHVDSLSFIIAYFNLQFHFFPSSIIFLMGIHHLFDGFAYTNRD